MRPSNHHNSSSTGQLLTMYSEDTSKRTQKSKHFYDPDTNKWRAEFTIADRHYKDDSDVWQDIDENLENDSGGFDKKCDKVRHSFKIASGGARRWYPRRSANEYVDITNIEYYTNRWNNLNLPAAVWKNQGAEWDMSYLYASITNTWRQIKSDFIMKNSSCPTRLRFKLGLTGLTYNHATGELTSIAQSVVVGYIQKPTGHDANDADVTVTSSYDGTYIEWSVDVTGKTYPIYVDPTFQDGNVDPGGDVVYVDTAFDTYLRQASPDSNYATGDAFAFVVTANQQRVGVVFFDVSSIAGSTVTSGTLTLHYNNTNTNAQNFGIYAILAANDGWLEAATWNHADGVGASDHWAGDTGNDGGDDAGCTVSGTDYDGTALDTWEKPASPNGGAGSWVDLDLTDAAVQDWVDGSNYGLFIKCTDAATTETVYIRSSDHATADDRPKLVVEYDEGGCVNVVVDVVSVSVDVMATVTEICEP